MLGLHPCVHALLSLVPRDVLFQHFESSEEGTRNVVAECVGKLSLVDPDTLLPKLRVSVTYAVWVRPRMYMHLKGKKRLFTFVLKIVSFQHRVRSLSV